MHGPVMRRLWFACLKAAASTFALVGSYALIARVLSIRYDTVTTAPGVLGVFLLCLVVFLKRSDRR